MEVTSELINKIIDEEEGADHLLPLCKGDMSKYIEDFFAVEYQSELSILCQYYQNILKHGRDELALPYSKLLDFLEIGRLLIHEGNLRHINNSRSLPSSAEVQEMFKNILDRYNLSYSQVVQFSDFYYDYYFKHFCLFRNVFSKSQSRKIKYQEISIDDPLPIMPLSQAVQRLKIEEIMKMPQFGGKLVRINTNESSLP